MTMTAHRFHLLSPAKINLFLQVTGKRADGYHSLFTLMCGVGIYDALTLDIGKDRTSVVCGHPQVPENNDNLALKAANLFFETLGRKTGVGITIDKHIPVGAGLGGGSGNAAAVLTTLNRHFGNPLKSAQLMSLGRSIGADVPFFIYGKPALVTGIGDTLRPFGRLDPHPLVLVFPGTGVSTASVYKNLNLGLTKCKNQNSYHPLSNRKFSADRDLCNDLEAAAASFCPEISEAKKALMRCGARNSSMSGSGSSVFGIFSGLDTAREAQRRLQQHDSWQVFLADMIV